MKKPVLLLTSALLLSLALTACGGEAPAESAAPSDVPAVSAAPAESALPADGDAATSATPGESAAPTESAVPEAAGDALYTPGVYTGVGEAYNGPITLEVEVDASSILAVTVVSHSDSEGIIQKCTDHLLPAMMEANTADVDPISGATLTSDGYKEAVRNALAQAAAN